MSETTIAGKRKPSRTSRSKGSRRASSKATPRATEATRNPSQPSDAAALGSLFAMNRRALEAFHQSNESLLSAFTSFTDEMLKFTEQSLKLSDQWAQSMATLQGHTRESVGSGFDYARVATEEYFQSTQKLLSLGQALSSEVWRPVETGLGEGSSPEKTE